MRNKSDSEIGMSASSNVRNGQHLRSKRCDQPKRIRWKAKGIAAWQHLGLMLLRNFAE